MKKYKDIFRLKFYKKIITVRYAGWDRCFNVLPYVVVRSNPYFNNWSDYSVEIGWLIYSFGVRVEPIYD